MFAAVLFGLAVWFGCGFWAAAKEKRMHPDKVIEDEGWRVLMVLSGCSAAVAMAFWYAGREEPPSVKDRSAIAAKLNED